MSHDELPPPAEPSGPPGDTATGPAREETSSPETPPAAGTRRRRARTAQAETASAPAPDTETPARPTRSRRKAAAPTDAPPTPPAAAEVSTPPAPEPAAAPETTAKPTRRRRTARTAAKAPAATESGEAAPAVRAEVPTESASISPPQETPAETEAPPAAPGKPTRRGGRTRRAKAVESPAPEASAPPAEEAPPAPTETAESAPETEPAGRRRRGGRRRAPAAETSAPVEATAAPAEEPTAEAPAPEAESVTEEAPRTRRNRRERGPRRTRSRETAPQAAATESVSVRSPGPEPIREEPIDRTVGAHLVWQHGLPEIHINAVSYPPILFFGNVEGAGNQQRVISEVRRAARAGVHLHSTLIELPCPLAERTEALDEIDRRLTALLDADPEGFVMPRIVFLPARGWKREYPNEIAVYADGTTGDPSITSERFWHEAELSLETLIEHLQSHEWGKRVFGYHLERGEWFQPADQGYDRSMANRDAFRDWLRDKYKNNLVALRAAWHDGDVQFHTAEIPPLLTKPNPQMAFYEPRRQRRYIDFHEFTSESTARRLIALARVIKRATQNQALVSICYGYTFEFGHAFSGHLALDMVQSAQAINLICGPPSYRDRKPGGAASLPAPVDSLHLHGKLWLSEDDTKTYLAPAKQDPDDFNPRLGDRFVTEQAQARAMGWALTHLTGIHWMDLWGEGWLDDEHIWERLGAFSNLYRAFLNSPERPQAPDVVVLIDEKSLLHVQRGETFFRRLTNGFRDTLQRAGISYGIYLQSDLLSNDFPTTAALYLFLTPYRLTPEQRAAIKEKLQRDNKTLAWIYAPGACEEYPSASGGMVEETAHSAVGFTLRQQEWNSEVGSRVIEPYHPLTERLPGRDIGPRERLNPSFYVEDKDATALAEYQGSGLPSLAVKNFGHWKSVFLGDPVLPLELLRGLCRYAGVHVWSPQGEDVVSVGNGWVLIHAAKDGQRTLYLPDALALYDVTEGRLIADEAYEYRFFLRTGMTRLFCVGTTEHFVAIGLPNVTLPSSDRPRIVLERATESRRDAPPGRLRSDLETLEAVLTMDVRDLEPGGLEDLPDGVEEGDEEPEATASGEEAGGEVVANGRRRRRRGGRGRWRRRTGSLSEGGEGPPAPPEGTGNAGEGS